MNLYSKCISFVHSNTNREKLFFLFAYNRQLIVVANFLVQKKNRITQIYTEYKELCVAKWMITPFFRHKCEPRNI